MFDFASCLFSPESWVLVFWSWWVWCFANLVLWVESAGVWVDIGRHSIGIGVSGGFSCLGLGFSGFC